MGMGVLVREAQRNTLRLPQRGSGEVTPRPSPSRCLSTIGRKLMATVRITLSTGNGDFEVTLDGHETNGQAWGSDKTYLNELVDEAVIRIKRAYTPVPERSDAANG